MKKIFLGIILNVAMLYSSTLVVDNNPTSGWFFGEYSCEAGFFPDYPYHTIQSAIANAGNGDTIKICKGDYNEAVTIDGINNLTITNGQNVTFLSDINWYSNSDTLTIQNNTKNLQVENLSIKSTSSSANNNDIYIKSAKNKITFNNLIIDSSNGANAIWGDSSVNNNLKGIFKYLFITSGASGIYLNKANLQDFENINMTLSSTSGNNKGIYLGTSVQDKNHIFKNLSLSVNAEPAIELRSGKKMTFVDVNITATGYGDNTKAISLDYSTTADNLTFKNVNINVNKGIGVYIAKAKDITANNLTISGTTNNAFLTDSQVTGNFSFDTLSMNINNDGGLVLKNGNDVTISHASISGSGGNGLGIFTDWGVVGNFTFNDVNVFAHAGGVDIKKGNNVSFSNVKVFSDSSSANDNGVVFDWGSFKKMSFINCDLNATGKALKISGSSDLTIDSSKLTTRGDSAIYIGTNVQKMHLKNSCIHNTSTSGNSYAIYIYNWKNDIHINNNCIYAPNGGNYASDTKAHDWDGNYWDGITDANGDGKISNADTNKISANVVDNSPKSSCGASSCNGSSAPISVIYYYMDECSWDNNSNTYEIKNFGTLGNDYNASAVNNANTITDGKIYRGGDINSSAIDDKAMLAKTDYSLPNKYTLTTWIKFPLNTDGHTIFSSNTKYFNIADRVGSANDFIYFTKDVTNNFWSLSIDDDSDSKSINFNPQNLSGWHMLTFVVTDKGTDFYLDQNKTNHFSTHPNTGQLGLLFNSDYGGNTDKPNGQSIGADVDEFKIFNQALSSNTIQNIYDNENSGKNYNGLNRPAPQCGGNPPPPVEKNYHFDAWDTFRNINDRNISTKIVKQDFNLTIASLDVNNTNYQEFNGTVCANIQNSVSTLIFHDQNSSTATFRINKAIKNTRVKLSWKKDFIGTCPLSNEDNSTLSTDNFAIRPEQFHIDTNTTSPKAGVNFHIDVNASSYDGTNSLDYNETNNTSFVFDINDSNATCAKGILKGLPTPFKFSNGGISFDANYSDVGDVNFSIKEVKKCIDRFAGVDCKDKNISGYWNTDTNLSIPAYSKTIIVKPYKFVIIDYNFTRNNPDGNWRYMGDVNDANITVSFKVEAQNANGGITGKFDKKCYSHNIGVKIGGAATSTDANISYLQKVNNTITSAHDRNLSDFNLSAIINDQNFTDGNSSVVMYALNVYKKYNKPVNPLDINITDINTTNSQGAINKGLIPDNNGSSFYYGRVLSKSITTNQQKVTNNLTLEVYDSNSSDLFVNGLSQDSLKWFQMKKDAFTHILNFVPKSGFLYSDSNVSGIDDINSTQSTSKGIVSFNIINHWTNSQNAYIHINIPSYLWYSHYNEYNATKDCSTHPCFQYIYTINNKKNNIQSGDFNGTSIGKDYNATRYQRGVKVFR